MRKGENLVKVKAITKRQVFVIYPYCFHSSCCYPLLWRYHHTALRQVNVQIYLSLYQGNGHRLLLHCTDFARRLLCLTVAGSATNAVRITRVVVVVIAIVVAVVKVVTPRRCRWAQEVVVCRAIVIAYNQVKEERHKALCKVFVSFLIWFHNGFQ